MEHADFVRLVAFDQGQLDEPEAIELFQRLIDSGDVWFLPGYYGRIARSLIEAGFCTYGPERRKDYYGNTIPSRFDLGPDEPGSVEYSEKHQESATNNEEKEE